MAVAVAIEAVVIALLGLLVCGLLRSHAEVLRTLRELEEDVPAPAGAARATQPAPPAARTGFDVVGTTLADEVMKVGVVGARQPTLLAFLSTGCLTCGNFWTAFAAGDRLAVPGGARLVVVTKGPAEESLSRLRDLAPPDLPVVLSTEAWEQYEVPVAPFFVYVDGPSGEIRATGAAETWDQVAVLWSRAVERHGGPGAARAARADHELLEAGIRPGHASLYGPTPDAREDG